MSKFHGDVRPLSHDPRYMGVEFQGTMKDAIKQAKAAINHGLPVIPMAAHRYANKATARDGRYMSRTRIALLQHLNLLPMLGW